MQFTKLDIITIGAELIIEDHIKGDPTFDWIDIVGIPQRPENIANSLYFATYSDGNDFWYYKFDRREQIKGVSTDKHWHIVVEENVDVSGVGSYLVVSSLTELASRLFEYAKNECKAKVIGVTGSVGKTTTVALLEHLLYCANYNVVRFWSKRLTPLSLQCHFLNRVNKNTDYIVLEYSTYFKNNIAVLAKLLEPNLAFYINLCNMHINPTTFSNKHEVFMSKLQIKSKKTKAYINSTVLNEVNVVLPKGWKVFEVDLNILCSNPALPKTLRTAEMITVASIVSKELGNSDYTLQLAIDTFTPKERRIPLVKYNEHNVFFDGEVSIGGRLYSWFETTDTTIPNFFVEEISFGDEDPNGFRDLLEKIYISKNTYVLDTPSNRALLSVDATFVDRKTFAQLFLLSLGKNLVYHKAMSTRQADFDPAKHLEFTIESFLSS